MVIIKHKSLDQHITEKEGVDSFNGNESEDACPYRIGDSRRTWWYRGYFAARSLLKFPKYFTLQELLASLLLVACLSGCGSLTVGPNVTPSPAPVKREANAAKCFEFYRSEMVSVMRAAAADLRKPGANTLDVSSRMGDSLKAARIGSFLPLTDKLDECETAEQMAAQWDKFADQLEGR